MFDNLNLITSKVLILLSKPKVLRLLGSKHSTKRIISGRSFQGGAANPWKITRLGYLSYLSNRPQIFLTGQELQTSANTSSSVARHTIVNPACKVQSTYMWAWQALKMFGWAGYGRQILETRLSLCKYAILQIPWLFLASCPLSSDSVSSFACSWNCSIVRIWRSQKVQVFSLMMDCPPKCSLICTCLPPRAVLLVEEMSGERFFEPGQHLDLAKGPIPPLDLFPPPIEDLKPPYLLNA